MFFCLSPRAYGAISLSNTTITKTWIGDNFGDAPWLPDIAITGTGNVSLGACTGATQVCGNIGASFSSASSPSTLKLYFTMFSLLGVANGTYTGHQTITGSSGCAATCIVDITITLLPRSSLYQPTVTNQAGGIFTGCGTQTTYRSWTFWPNQDGTFDTCGILPSQVPGGTFPFPGALGTFTDANVGGTVTQLIAPKFGFLSEVSANDAAATTWNVDGTRFFTSQQNGDAHIWLSSNNTIEFGTSNTLPTGGGTWTTSNPSVYYYVTGVDNFIHKIVLGTGPNGWVDTIHYTYPGLGPIKFGGNMQMSKDGFVAFLTCDGGGSCPSQGDNKICMLDVNNVATNPCTTAFPDAYYSPKTLVLSTGRDSVTGYYYLGKYDVPQDPPGHIEGLEILKWKPGDVNISHSHYHPIQRFYKNNSPFPGLGGACDAATYLLSICRPGAAHLTTVEIDGRQFISTLSDSSEQATSVVLELFAAGDKMDVPVEVDAAGGQYATFSVSPQLADTHVSCATFAPVCAVSMDSDSPEGGPAGSPITWWITAATTATPIHLTTTQSCGDGTDPRCPSAFAGSNGDVVPVSGIYGITGFTSQVGANGLCTVANLNGAKTEWDCAGTVGVGTYTASSGVIVQNIKPSNHSYQGRNLTFDYTNLLTLHTYNVIVGPNMRSLTYTTRYTDSYYGQGHTSLDMQGKNMNFTSNMGFAEQLTMFRVGSGYTPPPIVTGSIISGKTVISGKWVIH